MSLNNIHLRKLLAIMFMMPAKQRSEMLKDIRREITREEGGSTNGGDFYAAFWSDARAHVFESGDLYGMVNQRITANDRRRNLYPALRDGFLLWWNKRRRWTNKPFNPGRSIKGHLSFSELNVTVKIDSILSVRDGLDVERAVYPYFAPEPILSAEAARLGLWLLGEALPQVPIDEFRILDVIRGETFSTDRYPLQGDEREKFEELYAELLSQYDALREA